MIIDVYNHFKNSPTPNKLIGKDFMVIEYKCPLEEEYSKVMSDAHFLTFVISGKKDWILPDKKVTVEEGDALFIRAGAYSIRQYLDEDHCVLVFFMNDTFISQFVRENFRRSGERAVRILDKLFPVHVNDGLRTLFLSIFQLLKMGKDIPKNLVELKFRELLFNIMLEEKNADLASFFSSISSGNESSLEYVMLKNFQFDLTIEQFAALSNRSLSTFKRDFSDHFKTTPAKWIIDRRLEYACELLVESDLNVSEVCCECGFKNSSHFNKAFKEKYAKSPGQFRVSMLEITQ